LQHGFGGAEDLPAVLEAMQAQIVCTRDTDPLKQVRAPSAADEREFHPAMPAESAQQPSSRRFEAYSVRVLAQRGERAIKVQKQRDVLC
jgi:hypothetical protein